MPAQIGAPMAWRTATGAENLFHVITLACANFEANPTHCCDPTDITRDFSINRQAVVTTIQREVGIEIAHARVETVNARAIDSAVKVAPESGTRSRGRAAPRTRT